MPMQRPRRLYPGTSTSSLWQGLPCGSQVSAQRPESEGAWYRTLLGTREPIVASPSPSIKSARPARRIARRRRCVKPAARNLNSNAGTSHQCDHHLEEEEGGAGAEEGTMRTKPGARASTRRDSGRSGVASHGAQFASLVIFVFISFMMGCASVVQHQYATASCPKTSLFSRDLLFLSFPSLPLRRHPLIPTPLELRGGADFTGSRGAAVMLAEQKLLNATSVVGDDDGAKEEGSEGGERRTQEAEAGNVDEDSERARKEMLRQKRRQEREEEIVMHNELEHERRTMKWCGTKLRFEGAPNRTEIDLQKRKSAAESRKGGIDYSRFDMISSDDGGDGQDVDWRAGGLLSYALAVRYPVLTKTMLLCTRYAMSGTAIACNTAVRCPVMT
eukprot:2715849-Rhodomonas_salina.1